ncbi:MAG: tripartite tricarboxylate transporter substrate binding protein, partial [FCB group bacterium]|nr:tripartite tricarboxylate transporter substrate binding protein [FCB group bacterium]
MFLNRYLRQFLLLFVSWTLILSPKPLTAGEDFPAKPVKIIVYTGPGGLIDITARKFSQIASKYSDVNFIVENKPGAGGIVALKKILQSPADGYNLYACTKSNIAKFVQAGEKEYVDALDWTAMLMADPECVITNNQQQPYLWADLLDDARANSAKQTWVGPAAGGLDHVTAMKIWDTAGIKAKWIPFKSGGKAIAALLGGQGVAYVGNPRDVLGNPDLHIAAVSSSERLPAFPETPTFTELGLPDLEREFMWRGFALKQGTAPEIIDWYIDICQKVTDDREWQNFWAGGGIQGNL